MPAGATASQGIGNMTFADCHEKRRAAVDRREVLFYSFGLFGLAALFDSTTRDAHSPIASQQQPQS